MDIVGFLKPDLAKVLIFLIISATVLLAAHYVFSSCITSYYYPLPFATSAMISGGPGTPGMLALEYILPNYLINLLVYYLLSCLIVYAYGLFKK